jgi:hypothetical protein
MDALVLWTRDPSPLFPEIPDWETRGIRTAWLVTVTGYPRLLEPAAPPTDRAVEVLGKLAALVGRERIAWRYDPVLVCPSAGLDAAWHAENFARLAERLAPHAFRCIVSLCDDYAGARGRLREAGIVPDADERAREAAAAFAPLARAEGIEIRSCCEELEPLGIPPGGCIDGEWLDRLWRLGLSGVRDPGQRKGCRCAPSVDIGAYDTCIHGCLYCYAVRSSAAAARRRAAHDPAGERLA